MTALALPALTELADGVFAWIHDVHDRFTCNVGVVVEDHALTLIDSGGIPSACEALARTLRRFERPVRTVILTHAHGDHVAGARHFGPARVLCTPATAAGLAEPPPVPALQALHPSIAREIAALSHPTPDALVYDSEVHGRLHLDVLAGHTTSDLVVRVPDADVLFAGDLCFFGHRPLGIGADFPRWIRSLDDLGRWARVIVPGHGPVGGHADAAIVREYLAAVVAAAEAGTPVADGPWSSWYDPWADRLPGATDRINVEQARDPAKIPASLMLLVLGH